MAKITKASIKAAQQLAHSMAQKAELYDPTKGTLRPSYGFRKGTGGRGKKARMVVNMTSGRNATTGREFQPV